MDILTVVVVVIIWLAVLTAAGVQFVARLSERLGALEGKRRKPRVVRAGVAAAPGDHT